MFYCIYFLCLLKFVCSFNLKLDGNFSLVSKWHYTYTISGLSEETTEPSGRKTLRRIRLTATTKPTLEMLFEDGSLTDSSMERPPLKNKRTHQTTKRKTKATTTATTKFERGTTDTINRLSHRAISSLIDNKSSYVMRAPKGSRRGDYVYTFVNNTVNNQGQKDQQIIIYNQTHYLRYTGDVIPGDYVNLYKLWLQLKSSYSAKEFDDNFKPPWWMEWHKPPWWMDWHSPPPKALRNDTWEIWNQPGLKPPEPTVINYMNIDLNKMLSDFWGKVKKPNQQDSKPVTHVPPKAPRVTVKRKGHLSGRVKTVNGPMNLWQHLYRSPSTKKVVDHLLSPIPIDYVYSYVNSSVNEKGERRQKVIIYNKTHYLVYTGKVVPTDYNGLCKLWADLRYEYIAKEFDDVFRPPWWMEWHRPPWWMEWHTPPPGMMANDTWEIWNQPGMKPAAARNSFDFSKWIESLWGHVKDDHAPINSWEKMHRNPNTKHVIQHLQSPVVTDYVYSYVNTSINAQGEKVQKVILYNKTHYLEYYGRVVPVDYVGLCRLWAQLRYEYTAREFDDNFKPPWWMEWHRPPWWMEWHTPPPGMLANETWEIWNQPGMKPPSARNTLHWPKWIEDLAAPVKHEHAPSVQKIYGKPSTKKVVDHLLSPIPIDYVYSYVNSSVNDKGERRQTVIIYNKTHYLVYTGKVVPTDYNGLCKLWSDLRDEYSAKEFDNIFRPPWWMEWHRPPWWMEWHTPPPGMMANDTWEIWNQPGMKPAAARNSFDLTKWIRQLWHEVINHDSKEKSRKQTEFSDSLPQPYPYPSEGPKPPDRHLGTQPHRFQIGPRKIRDDATIKSFAKHILNSTLNLFDTVRDKTPEHHWKRGISRMARSYESKYKEYLRTIKDQQIKSDLGTRKVILNAIDVSNRIVKRLVNSMMDEMDKKKALRSDPTPAIFQREIDKVVKTLLDNACSRAGICKADNSIIQLLIDILNVVLKVDEDKFKEAFHSGVAAMKNTGFYTRVINIKRNSNLQSELNVLERKRVRKQKLVILIVKHIIENRNAPISVPAGPANKFVSKTLVFQDIVNKIEDKVPVTAESIEAWNSIRSDINAWAINGGPNIRTIMVRLANKIDQCISHLDIDSYDAIIANVKKLVG